MQWELHIVHSLNWRMKNGHTIVVTKSFAKTAFMLFIVYSWKEGGGPQKMKSETHLFLACFALSVEKCYYQDSSCGNSLHFKLQLVAYNFCIPGVEPYGSYFRTIDFNHLVGRDNTELWKGGGAWLPRPCHRFATGYNEVWNALDNRVYNKTSNMPSQFKCVKMHSWPPSVLIH